MAVTAITTPLASGSVAEASDVNAPATGNAAVVTNAGQTGYRWFLGGVAVSYNGTPTAGRLRVCQMNAAGTVVESTVLDVDITAAGLTLVPFAPAKVFDSGKGFRVQLDGVAGLAGKVSILSKWLILA